MSKKIEYFLVDYSLGGFFEFLHVDFTVVVDVCFFNALKYNEMV